MLTFIGSTYLQACLRLDFANATNTVLACTYVCLSVSCRHYSARKRYG